MPVGEPLGGAHRDPDATAAALKASIVRHLDDVGGQSSDELLDNRYARIAAKGQFKEG